MIQQGGSNDIVDVVDCIKDAFALISLLISVSKLARFELTGTGSAWNGGSTHRSRLKLNINFDGGISTAVNNFSGNGMQNVRHLLKITARRVTFAVRNGTDYLP